MALDKRIKERINSIMESKPHIGMEELIEIVKEYAPKPDLQKVRQQLSKKYRGLNKSLRKIDIREQILDGQLSIEDVRTEQERSVGDTND